MLFTKSEPITNHGEKLNEIIIFKRHQADQAWSGNPRKEYPSEEKFQDFFNDRNDVNPKLVVASLSSDTVSSITSEQRTNPD